MGALQEFAVKTAVLPPGLTALLDCDDVDTLPDAPTDADEPQAIAGFMCVIEYADAHGEVTERLITCRRYLTVGGNASVGAICGNSRRYKLFRCDRIMEVCDAETGASLGDGSYFGRFTVSAAKPLADMWDTTSQRKSLIVAGLNVLAFMARCDGHWHPLEAQTIEDFICSLWLRKEWEGSPPLDRIVAHARRLAPDGEVFENAIRQYAHSSTSRAVLTQYVQRVIAADGVICEDEHRWAACYAECMEEAVAAEAEARRAAR